MRRPLSLKRGSGTVKGWPENLCSPAPGCPARLKKVRPGGSRPMGVARMPTDLQRILSSIGPKLRALRKQTGLSLQQLSDRSDVSPAAIHKIEQGDMVPTITTLLKIAGALNRPVSYFVDEEQDATEPMEHPGEELIYVVEGELDFDVNGRRYTLRPNDALHFRTDQKHSWAN